MSVQFGTGTTKIAQSQFVAGVRYNIRNGGLGSTKNVLCKIDIFVVFEPQKALVRGVSDLVPVRSKSAYGLYRSSNSIWDPLTLFV